TVRTVDQIAQATLDDGCAKGDTAEVEQSDQQRQTGETQEMAQVSTFQVKAMTLEVRKHLLDPHAPTIGSKRLLLGGKIGCQKPGMFFARLPVSQEIERKGKALR